nr:hypothetical protein [uncultured Lichenicoccus sp.]
MMLDTIAYTAGAWLATTALVATGLCCLIDRARQQQRTFHSHR